MPSHPPASEPHWLARFLRTEAAGGVALVVAAVVALVWVNSGWRDGYDSLWHSHVSLGLGDVRVEEDLRHLVNEGLMALFFFVVGLEIKRELVRGELADPRVAALPVLGAIGGMVVPALLYVAVTAGGVAGHGWGIPMATDIAFALGVIALLGPRVPSSLKLFLLALAIVDDVGAIVVIAFFYGDAVDWVALALAAAGLVVAVAARRLRVGWWPIHLLLAIAVWYATYRSGVHATIAGVALALTTPTGREGASRTEDLEVRLHPVTSFLVLPVVALANAGVVLRSDLLSPPGAGAVAGGVALGLVAGKLLGILTGAWLGVRLRIAVLPEDLRWSHIAGAAALGGVGFTVSLFIAGLAFPDPALADAAKVAILAASVTSAAAGAAILLSRPRTGSAASPPAS
jgi:NhaA family Na+:H+ antiporter